jgi:hypothetical protein
MEPLEDRRLLANVTVSNLNDVVNGTTTSIADLIATPGADGISLREAILAANADTTFNDPPDTIDFSVTGTIQLTNVGHVGEIAISSNLTINGPGADLLAVRAFDPSLAIGNGTRIFNIQMPFFTRTVAISGLTLTGGDASGSGGGILNSENLAVSGCTISDNRASSQGGGIANITGGNLTVTNSTISGNLAGFNGGGILSYQGSLTVSQSTISGNSVGSGNGGGVHSSSSPTTIDSSTISLNYAAGAGGIFSENAGLTITSSTISRNSVQGSGGGLVAFSGLTLRHSTVTLNRSDSDNNGGGTGGGLLVAAGAVMEHTIVAGNLRSTFLFDDISGTLAARFSLIGDGTGATITDNGGNQIGTAASPIDPLLGQLANNGGPTMTHALQFGSPAIDAGDPTVMAGSGGAPLFDQRGATFDRMLDGDIVGGARIDLGAFEFRTLVVDKLGDETDGNTALGELTLREAIQQAHVGGAGSIAFSPLLTNSGPAAIVLTQGELVIGRTFQIVGPGAHLLTIDASGNDPTPLTDNGDGSRVFKVGSEFSTLDEALFSISGLTLTGGDVATDGGAILNSDLLTLRACTISGNHAESEGGGIHNYLGFLNVVDSTISANEAALGGGIANDSGATITGSTISGNTASFGGGVMTLQYGHTDIRHSTITGNMAPGSGGGGVFSVENFGFIDTVTRVYSSMIAGNAAGDVSSISNFPGGAPSVFSSGYNVIGADNTGAFNRPGDVEGIANPLLGPLANNGGPTMTHALLAGSPAINAGDPAAVAGVGDVPAFDQRGFAFNRVVNGRIDIGAFESGTTSADFDADLDVDGNDFLLWQRGLGALNANATHAKGNADFDADVDAADLAIWRSQFGAAAVAANLTAESSPSAQASSRTTTEVQKSAVLLAAAVDAAVTDQFGAHSTGRKPFRPHRFQRRPG